MRKRHALIASMAAFYRVLNRFVPWHKLPHRILPRLSLRLWNLPALRHDLRRWNLHDTASLPTRPKPAGYNIPQVPGLPLPDPFKSPDPSKPEDLVSRRADGTYNDLQAPRMGGICSRFGRNFPPDDKETWPRDPVGDPSPRDISNILLARDSFKAAESLNLLAAAWIQFMVHDWARHRPDLDPQHRVRIPLKDGDPWKAKGFGNAMEIEPTPADDTRPDGCQAGPPTFLNDGTFWWDGSQIYGSDLQLQQTLRLKGQDGKFVDGKLTTVKVGNDDRLPDHPGLPGQDLTGFMFGWWAGLSLLHTLFVKEHNAICDELKAKYGWTDDARLFWTAQLITAALIAKIHTVEWTPAILGQPILKIGMDANWWGVLGESLYKRLGRVGHSEELSGIPGSELDHHGVPFSLTEEFVSVYRMHPLIPDQYRFHSLQKSEFTPHVPVNGASQLISTFDHIQGQKTRQALTAIGMDNAFYSFGLAHPGAITLGNYPHFLRQYEPPGHPHNLRMDLASVDVFRDRERGIPPYNKFRQLLRMPRVKSFDELNPKWAQTLSDVYKGRIDRVDAMVGMFAEEPPKGFGFSDTAFRIFILMASRRLKSDRFFTTDYRPEVYTKAGLDWINDNGFESVLLRHYKALGPAVHGLANPFRPWRNVHDSAAA